MEERPDENKDVLAVFSRGATHIYLKKVMASSLKKKKLFRSPFCVKCARLDSLNVFLTWGETISVMADISRGIFFATHEKTHLGRNKILLDSRRDDWVRIKFIVDSKV